MPDGSNSEICEGEQVNLAVLAEYFPGVDKRNIGKFISSGNNHSVFKFLNPEKPEVPAVLKMPRRGKEHNNSTYDEEKRDYEILRNDCPIKVIEARLIPADKEIDGKIYACIIQDAVQFENLTPEHLVNNPNLRVQFQKLLEYNRKKVKEGWSVDFFGIKGAFDSTLAFAKRQAIRLGYTAFAEDLGPFPAGVFLESQSNEKPKITNIVVIEEKGEEKLAIIDYGLLWMTDHPGDQSHKENSDERFKRTNYAVTYQLNRELMKRFFSQNSGLNEFIGDMGEDINLSKSDYVFWAITFAKEVLQNKFR